jgi:hypothetical protein
MGPTCCWSSSPAFTPKSTSCSSRFSSSTANVLAVASPSVVTDPCTLRSIGPGREGRSQRPWAPSSPSVITVTPPALTGLASAQSVLKHELVGFDHRCLPRKTNPCLGIRNPFHTDDYVQCHLLQSIVVQRLGNDSIRRTRTDQSAGVGARGTRNRSPERKSGAASPELG